MEAMGEFFQKLSFDKKLENSFFNFFVENARLISLLILVIVGIGVSSYASLPREVNPEINIPISIVNVVYPGAGPEEIETSVIKPIEDRVSEIPNIDRIESTARESLGSVVITFNSNEDPDEALDLVKEKMDLVTLPDQAEDANITKVDFSNVPLLEVLVLSEAESIEISKFVDVLKTNLEDEKTVSEVSLNGFAEEVIEVILKPEKISELGLNPTNILRELSANNLEIPAGEISINNIDYRITTKGKLENIEDVRNQILNVDGELVRLGDVADIKFKVDEDTRALKYIDTDGQVYNSVKLTIFKSESASIYDAVADAENVLNDTFSATSSFRYVVELDLTENVDDQFGELQSNFLSTVALVFFVLLLFLGLRQSFTAAISIPLTFLSTFVAMQIIGITLNFLSLFSLLLALGLVVDDAIVIVSAFSMYKASGKFASSREIGLMVFKDFIVPIYTTTLTTVWAFVPLLLSTGIIGEFIKSIPVVVTSTLIASTTIAVFINIPTTTILDNFNPPKRLVTLGKWILILAIVGALGVALLDFNSQYIALRIVLFIALLAVAFVYRKSFKLNLSEKTKTRLAAFWTRVNQGFIDLSGVKTRYSNILRRIIFSKWQSLGVIGAVILFIIVSFSFIPLGFLKTDFFPSEDAEFIIVNFEANPGTTKTDLIAEIEKNASGIFEIPEVRTVGIFEGSNILPTGDRDDAENFGYLNVELIEDYTREDTAIADQMRDILGEISSFSFDVVVLNDGGPPAGADIQVNISGPDLAELKEVANKFEAVLEENENAGNVGNSLNEATGTIEIKLLPYKLAEKGETTQSVAPLIRSLISGSEFAELDLEFEDTKVILKSSADLSLGTLQNLQIPNPGGSYSLAEIAEINLKNSFEEIQRLDGDRVVIVTASAENISSTELFAILEPEFEALDIPEGYTWATGGVNEENQESTQAIVNQMGLALMLILVTMILQLNSFRKAVIVLTIIPLAVVGVIFNFTIFGIPLSFPSLIGILSLFGIVVNNSIMLVEKINKNINLGISFKEALVEGCTSRLEPILFTTLTTIMGLLPITLSDPFWQGLGGAIIAGLSVSGIIILIFLPVVFNIVYSPEMGSKRWG